MKEITYTEEEMELLNSELGMYYLLKRKKNESRKSFRRD